MSHDQAVAKFLASIVTLWHDTPRDDLAAIGSMSLVLDLGASVVRLTPTDDPDEEPAPVSPSPRPPAWGSAFASSARREVRRPCACGAVG